MLPYSEFSCATVSVHISHAAEAHGHQPRLVSKTWSTPALGRAAQAAQRAASRPSPWSTGDARFWQQNAILERARGGDYFRTTAEQHRVLNDAVLAATQAVCSAATLNLLAHNIWEEDA